MATTDFVDPEGRLQAMCFLTIRKTHTLREHPKGHKHR